MDRSLELGLRLGFGPAVTPVADDPAGALTLLGGTAFTGTALNIDATVRYRFTNAVGLRSGVGLVRSSVMGFAEAPDGSFRRELTLRLVTLGVPVAVEGGWDFGRVRANAFAGGEPRVGVLASADELRSGTPSDEPALAIRTGVSFGVVVGAEFAVDAGRYSFPVGVRYRRNLTYGRTTEDRFSAPNASDGPGRYLVDTRWDLVVSVGFDVGLGGQRGRRDHEVQVVVPPPPAPPLRPAAPAQPDQDGDSVPDRLDACPIEPANPADNPSYPGCGASGGIVQLSCDRLYLGAPIDFESGSDVIQASSYPLLYLLADTLELADNVRYVRIEGHTDDRGSTDTNQQLSEARAYSVMQFLVDVGIDASRLEAVGYGEDYPIADNQTEAGRAENRRVEFHIVENTTCTW